MKQQYLVVKCGVKSGYDKEAAHPVYVTSQDSLVLEAFEVGHQIYLFPQMTPVTNIEMVVTP